MKFKLALTEYFVEDELMLQTTLTLPFSPYTDLQVLHRSERLLVKAVVWNHDKGRFEGITFHHNVLSVDQIEGSLIGVQDRLIRGAKIVSTHPTSELLPEVIVQPPPSFKFNSVAESQELLRSFLTKNAKLPRTRGGKLITFEECLKLSNIIIMNWGKNRNFPFDVLVTSIEGKLRFNEILF